MGRRINTVMQTCSFASAAPFPATAFSYQARHRENLPESAARTSRYMRRISPAVDQSRRPCDESRFARSGVQHLTCLRRCRKKLRSFSRRCSPRSLPRKATDLPVSAMPIVDGTFPSATAQWEKRNIALEIRCGMKKSVSNAAKCILVCPHAVVRAQSLRSRAADKRSPTFKSAAARWKGNSRN